MPWVKVSNKAVYIFMVNASSFGYPKSMEISAREQAKALPTNPGCYLMKDKDGEVIYVGKAKNLRNRVTSYFLANRNVKTAALVEKIVNINYIITGNEYEALILENNLIKKYNPHYNILLKDGKSYPVIQITKEKFPRVLKTRRIIKDGSKYYGPYPDVKRLDTYLELIYENYPIRRCHGVLKPRKTPCLYYHLHKCGGPCIGKEDADEYNKYIRDVEEFLDGDDTTLIHQVEKEMERAARNLDFEGAAKKRDILKALNFMQKNQMVEDLGESDDSRDYASIEMRSYLCTISIMQFRDSRLIGKALYRAESLGDETETLLSFLMQYYSDGDTLPKELYVSCEIDRQMLQRFFKEELNSPLKVEIPTDGKHYRILRMAEENASRDVEKRLKSVDNTPALEELKDKLGLEKVPYHIEGFDIAQLAGKYTVASLIVFRDGNPSNKEYRHFSMKSLNGKIDDFQSMREAVYRRYRRLIDEGSELPDLLMVDGGKGQVSAALDALSALGISFPVVGLAKEHEEIVFPTGPSLFLDHSDPALRVLIALRDECHRFATSFNQRMRSKEASFTLLESIKGVGKERSKRIMQTYDSVEAILELTPEELAKGAKIPVNVAERVLKKLNF